MKTRVAKSWSLLTVLLVWQQVLGGDANSGATGPVPDSLLPAPAIQLKWRNSSQAALRSAATNGNATAQHELASRLFASQNSGAFTEAHYWANLAAEKGIAASQVLLSWAYLNGKGVGRDRAVALVWAERAAKQGFTEGEYQFGYLLTRQFNTNGQQIADFHLVAEWYRKAAVKGHAVAQFELGE